MCRWKCCASHAHLVFDTKGPDTQTSYGSWITKKDAAYQTRVNITYEKRDNVDMKCTEDFIVGKQENPAALDVVASYQGIRYAGVCCPRSLPRCAANTSVATQSMISLVTTEGSMNITVPLRWMTSIWNFDLPVGVYV